MTEDDLSDWPKPPRRGASILLATVGVILLLPGVCTIAFFIQSGIEGVRSVGRPGSERIIAMMVFSLLTGALGAFLLRLARKSTSK